MVIFLPLHSAQLLYLRKRNTHEIHPVVETLRMTSLEIKRQPGKVAARRQYALWLTRRTCAAEILPIRLVENHSLTQKVLKPYCGREDSPIKGQAGQGKLGRW